MTATATIKATERRDVLLVPNTALRFTPALANAAAAKGGGIVSSLIPRQPGAGGAPRTATAAAGGDRPARADAVPDAGAAAADPGPATDPADDRGGR
jgi:HlyD family secretion protein